METPELILRAAFGCVVIAIAGVLFQSWMRKKFPSLPAPSDVSRPPASAILHESGISSRVIIPGSGQDHPGPTSTVTVHYTGWQTNGSMFDSSLLRKKPSTFPLDRVIVGWREGLMLMVEGEHRRIWIPESLAYGPNPDHGPSGMLVFDITLIKIG